MKYFYIKFILLLITLPFFGNAQSNFKPGYVITLKDDTLRGYIDYREWDVNPSEISFKKNLNDNKQRLTPDDIKFFNIDNVESYQKYSGPISTDVINIDRLSEGRDSSFRTAVVFLRILQKGKNVALYEYSDPIKTRFYIGETPAYTPRELEFKMYYAAVANASGRTVTENTFLKQLFALANKYQVLDDRFVATIENSGYTKSAILNIVSRINNFSDKEHPQRTDKSKLPLFLYAGIGANISSVQAGAAYYANGGKDHTSILPMAAVGLNIFANPVTQKLAFRIEGSLATSHYSSNYDNKAVPYVNITYSYSQIALAFTPQVVYNFYNSDSFKYYLGAGMAITYNKFSNEVFTSKSGPVLTAFHPFVFYPSTNPFMVKTGVLLDKKVEISLTYLTRELTTQDIYYQLATSSLQLSINYFFGHSK